MNSDLLQKLKDWRRKTANSEGIEPFRVFANKVLENIAEVKPANKEELMAIKGIRDKKFAQYGKDILALINNGDEEPGSSKPISVGNYLNLINNQLSKHRARIQGEISDLDIRERVVYFSLKDLEDESVINCLIWKNDYQLNGIKFEIGMEIIIEGCPEVYKPSGRLSFKAFMAELVGEGALKKAYELLRQKLEKEGLFNPAKKRPIPEYPQHIGLITSSAGAVINDFLSNLGKFGYKIKFMDSRVEGKTAVLDLIQAVRYFKDKKIDTLVIIRGGGSLESLQAFNNEALVREISNFPVPVIAGIGHEKDITLVSLTADAGVSTPTATTKILNSSWEQALAKLQMFERDILNKYKEALVGKKYELEDFSRGIIGNLNRILNRFAEVRRMFVESILQFEYALKDARKKLTELPRSLVALFAEAIIKLNGSLNIMAGALNLHNPERQLRLGYSIVKLEDKIVRSINNVKKEDIINIEVTDGLITSRVYNIKNKKL